MNCIACGDPIDSQIQTNLHPSCLISSERPELQALGEELKSDVITMIRWADANSARSLQIEPGPSELGEDCPRRLAYRLAQIPEVNNGVDPWAAIVGTSIHNWLERGINEFQAAHSTTDWLTETELSIDNIIIGHSDAYWYKQKMVVDWKTMSAKRMQEVREAGAAAMPGGIIQAHLYGYGYTQHGYPVDFVALLCLPRSGRLRDAIPLVEPYDERIARYALDRMYEIAELLVAKDVYADPSAWKEIPARASNSCGLCPWYDSTRLNPADNTGCPGIS